jgi:ribosomal protein S18 acetylase RimI-like enzyme
LEYIVVHPANRGRGVAERLVEEVCRMEEEKVLKSLNRAVVQFIVV